MKLRLHVRQSASKAFAWEHTSPLLRVGRDPASELSLQGDGTQSVSWNHARVELTADGAFVTDLGSSNGTFVNGKRAEGRTPFRTGDFIELGHTGPKLQVTELAGCGAAPRVHAATTFEPLPAAPKLAAPVPVAPVIPGRTQPAVAPAPSRSMETSAPGGTTRMLLVKLQTSQRRNMMFLGVAVASVAALVLIVFLVLGILGVVVFSKRPQVAQLDSGRDVAPPAGLKPEEIFHKTLPSTVWVVVPHEQQSVGFGSGALVDRDRKLILTAQHVVGDRQDVAVFFPHYDDNKLMLKKEFYFRNANRLGIDGRVVARDVKRDIALIQLDHVPADAPVLALADESPSVGQTVYSLGNPGLQDIDMWMLTTGTVRQVHQKQWRYADRAPRDAWTIETQSPTNPGDSGGPAVNSEAKLVGIVAGSKNDSNLMTFFIDRREIADLLSKAR